MDYCHLESFLSTVESLVHASYHSFFGYIVARGCGFTVNWNPYRELAH